MILGQITIPLFWKTGLGYWKTFFMKSYESAPNEFNMPEEQRSLDKAILTHFLLFVSVPQCPTSPQNSPIRWAGPGPVLPCPAPEPAPLHTLTAHLKLQTKVARCQTKVQDFQARAVVHREQRLYCVPWLYGGNATALIFTAQSGLVCRQVDIVA